MLPFQTPAIGILRLKTTLLKHKPHKNFPKTWRSKKANKKTP